MPGERFRARLRELVFDTGSDPTDASALLARVCAVAAAELDVGAAVLLVGTTGSEPDQSEVVAAASSDRARLVLELELDAGEGPGRSALALSRPVLTPDLGQAQGHWPGYGTAAAGAGVGSVFAFPLHVGAVQLGVLVAHRDRPGSLSRVEVASLLMVAELATDILLDQQLPGAAGPDTPGFLGSMQMADEIYQAQGMVMAALGVTLPAALAILRARAFADDRRLRDLAVDVVHGRVDLPDYFHEGELDPQ